MKRKLNISLPSPAPWITSQLFDLTSSGIGDRKSDSDSSSRTGINFTPASASKNISTINQANDGGLTIHASSNVAIMFTSPKHDKPTNANQFSQGTTKTITSKDLHDISKVEVVYLGS